MAETRFDCRMSFLSSRSAFSASTHRPRPKRCPGSGADKPRPQAKPSPFRDGRRRSHPNPAPFALGARDGTMRYYIGLQHSEGGSTGFAPQDACLFLDCFPRVRRPIRSRCRWRRAIAGTVHCQDREPHAGAAEARQKMEAVRQVSRVRRHRIHPREPKTPQRCFVDFRRIRHGFAYDHHPQGNSL
jgi:hypothetical protein